MSNNSNFFLFSFFKMIFSMFKSDLTSRTYGVLLQYFASIFPDLYIFNFIRVWSLYFAGCKFKNINSVVIRSGVFMEFPKNVYIGEGVQINKNTYFASNGKVVIGDYTRFAMNVQVTTVGHKGLKNEIDTIEPISIGSHCWIGANSVILQNVSIGDKTIIAAGSVVNNNIHGSVVAGGFPVKILKQRLE